MQQRRTAEEPAPPRTYRPLRQVVVYLCITYAVDARRCACTTARRDHTADRHCRSGDRGRTHRRLRRSTWSATRGLGGRSDSTRGGGEGLLIAVLGPAAIIAVSFGVAAAFGVVRFPGLGPGFGSAVLNLTVTTVIFAVVFLGEEIGWRGYLLFRVAELTSGRRAAVLTGAFHAIFHLPLLLLTTTYQSEGKRWIVVPMVMVTLTLGWCLVRVAAAVVGKHLAGQLCLTAPSTI